MIRDKLDKDQRIRLECLAQAIIYFGTKNYAATTDSIVEQARAYEEYVKG